jgi:K+-sensing histidine kinase KdpD
VEEQTAALQESLKLKEQLLGLLVHDVRYPVQSFHGISKKLNYLIQKNDFERLTLLGKETETRSKKVLWLIDELVYWIKGANKNWEPTKQSCNLGEIIEQLFEVYSEELTEKWLSYEIFGKNIISNTDQSLLIIVLRNVIFNTVIHAIPHTKIVITVTQQEGLSTIRLQNQYDPQVKSHHQGLGVGLSILESILEKANFTIHTSSDISKQEYICTVSF